ncbi:MAG: dihydrofolate reductase [Candidatus Aenigmarchaeota archaeon]|nr:dihydrofolate reductase [Candidatus Aenigmarchaeota archaeon]
MPRLILYIAMSLDGYIARKDGAIDWLEGYDEEEYGYQDFYRDIGAVILGKTTYDQALGFPEFPYKNVDCYVFTHEKKPNEGNIIFVSGNAKDFMEFLKPKAGNIWLVGGSSIIAEFMKHNLIDDFIITIVPTLLGSGIPLFQAGFKEQALAVKDVKHFPSGLVQAHYVRK